MGKDWYRLGGHGGANCNVDGGGGTPISSSTSKRKTYAANGCMAALHHLFDFQLFYFNSHHRHHLSIDSPARSKGLKFVEESTSSSSSEICNSPGIKTPNLVARLMGLDLLPHSIEFNHPQIVTHHGSGRLTGHRLSKKSTRLGTKSLPESPRISSARKSDFDIHRLSLQLNKENKHEGLRCSRLKELKQEKEENLSPREYAREIVKQIKERVVTRRVGMDITNSVMNRKAGTSQNLNELRRDSTVSCSARTRFSDKENTPSISHKTNFRPEQITKKPKPLTPKQVILVSVSETSGDKQKLQRIKPRQLRPINQCKKVESETKFSPRPIKPSPTPDIRNKQREAFVSVSSATQLSPSIFFKLEESQENRSESLSLRCNRKLLFDLVNEILIDIAEIHRKQRRSDHGSDLINELSSAVARYSHKSGTASEAKGCTDVEHVVQMKKLKEEEEGKEVIAEIERDIIDQLVHETTSALVV